MTSTKTRQRRSIGVLLAVAACTVPGPAAWADIGPPVKITMPPDYNQALSGQVYEGVFDTEVFTNPPANPELQVTYTANSVIVEALASTPGDCDDDGDVDLIDYACFHGCLTGPAGGLLPGCEPFDFDADNDVDLLDFAQMCLAIVP